jgi:hypothetical protein
VCLSVEDLLEHLAHARPHQVPLLGRGVPIATPVPRHLLRVEVLTIALRFVVLHGVIVERRDGSVNRLI